MEGLELISFNIISNVGSAKSLIMESMIETREGRFSEAERMISEANEFLTFSEKEHFKVITQEAKKEEVHYSILFMHAEDQLMSTVTLRDIANELMERDKLIIDLQKQIMKKG